VLSTKVILMKKEELIQIHMLLAQFKKYCEENGVNGDFRRYNALRISPFQVHSSKDEHKQAILVLGNELVSSLAANCNSDEHRNHRKERKKVLVNT
jgi:hypothetical protein